MLDPNREVNPQYLNYVVLTEEGRAITGMIAAESATSVTLQRAESASDTVLRVDIDQLQSTGLSIMPEGMEETIDQQSMADIIAYLMQVGFGSHRPNSLRVAANRRRPEHACATLRFPLFAC